MDTNIALNQERILIIHPEGNIFNNPNLYSIIKFLSNYYLLDVLIPKLIINDNLYFPESTINLIEYKDIFTEDNLFSNLSYLDLFIDCYISNSYSLIIGVDRLGLILSYLISRLHNISYAFISYEIFFADETPNNYKALEIIASKNVSFVIVQDEDRAQQLSYQNIIDLTRMILIPVASSHVKVYKKSYLLHEKLNIDKNKKIVLLIGSINAWSCIRSIVDEMKYFPNDWVMVFHDRYNQTKSKFELFYKKDISNLNNIYFSNIKINKTEDMNKIIHCADIGLSLYCPDYQGSFTGKNIEYIGLASGKTSTYLQNGLPIITTKNRILSKYINSYKIGYEIENPKNLIDILKHFKPTNNLNNNCIKFFKDILSFNNYKDELLFHIKKNINTNSQLSNSIEKNEKIKLYNQLKHNYVAYGNEFLAFSSSFNKFYDFVIKLQQTGFRYIIYGNGTVGKTIQKLMPENIVAFVDINNEKVEQVNVYNPKKLTTLNYDKIIISVLGREDIIKKYLVEQIGIDSKRLITININS